MLHPARLLARQESMFGLSDELGVPRPVLVVPELEALVVAVPCPATELPAPQRVAPRPGLWTGRTASDCLCSARGLGFPLGTHGAFQSAGRGVCMQLCLGFCG